MRLFAFVALLISLFGVSLSSVSASDEGPPAEFITAICHAPLSSEDAFVYMEVNEKEFVEHSTHKGDVLDGTATPALCESLSPPPPPIPDPDPPVRLTPICHAPLSSDGEYEYLKVTDEELAEHATHKADLLVGVTSDADCVGLSPFPTPTEEPSPEPTPTEEVTPEPTPDEGTPTVPPTPDEGTPGATPVPVTPTEANDEDENGFVPEAPEDNEDDVFVSSLPATGAGPDVSNKTQWLFGGILSLVAVLSGFALKTQGRLN